MLLSCLKVICFRIMYLSIRRFRKEKQIVLCVLSGIDRYPLSVHVLNRYAYIAPTVNYATIFHNCFVIT